MSRFTVVVLAWTLVFTCTSERLDAQTRSHHEEPAHGSAEWGYEGAAGPAHWGSLSDEYAACGSGKHQSPVDLCDAVAKELPPIVFDYDATPLNLINNGHTVELLYAKGSKLRIGEREYEVAQVHFHTPSEHVVEGRRFPLEMHVVHKDAGGAIAVVSVLFEPGEPSPVLETFVHLLPRHPGDRYTSEVVRVNALHLLPPIHVSYHYTGSLTTPPCTEGVEWYVMREPVSASKQQIFAFHAFLSNDSRPLQPLEGRKILVDPTPEVSVKGR